MEEPSHPFIAQEAIDEPVDDAALADDDAADREALGEARYVPDPRVLWGSEAARAMLVVLTRRFGPDFAREVSDELAGRTLSYQAGCPDDQRDGDVMQGLLCDRFWDALLQMPANGKGRV